MNSILAKPRRSWARHILPLSLFLSLSSCVYRFSNSSLRPPEGIRSIAIEAVYDTSRDVIPHELIWSAIQREVARSGRLILSSHEEADALMTLWVSRSSVSPSGTPTRDPRSRDPIASADSQSIPPEFRDLRRAGSWTSDEQVGFTVEVEVHDLKSRRVIFKNIYDQTTAFKSLRAESITPIASGFLAYEEALQAKVKLLADQMAQRVVTDFFALHQTSGGLQW